MSEEQEMREERVTEGLALASHDESVLPLLLNGGIGSEGYREQWQTLQTCRFKPNLGFVIGLSGALSASAMMLLGCAIALMAWVVTWEPVNVGGLLFKPFLLLIVSLVVILISLRRESWLLASSKALRIESSGGSQVIRLDQMISVEPRVNRTLKVHLKSGGSIILPATPLFSGSPPPHDALLSWFRNRGIKVAQVSYAKPRLLGSPIYLPELHGGFRWPKQGLWVVIMLMALDLAGCLTLLASGAWQANRWAFGVAFAVLLLLIPFELFLLIAPFLLRRWWAKATLEFTESGVKITSRGSTEPELDQGSFRRFIIESRREWQGLTKKRLCAETHYGRRIPLTGFALNWPLEAEQILHQAGERGIPVVLRKQGDEEPLEIP